MLFLSKRIPTHFCDNILYMMYKDLFLNDVVGSFLCFPNFISQQSWSSSTDTLTPLIKSPLTPFWPPSLVPHLFPKMSVASSPQLLACKFYGINLRDNRCRRAALVPQTGPYVVSLQPEGCHNTSNYSFLLKTFLSGTVGSCSTVSYSSGFSKSNLIQTS